MLVSRININLVPQIFQTFLPLYLCSDSSRCWKSSTFIFVPLALNSNAQSQKFKCDFMYWKILVQEKYFSCLILIYWFMLKELSIANYIKLPKPIYKCNKNHPFLVSFIYVKNVLGVPCIQIGNLNLSG